MQNGKITITIDSDYFTGKTFSSSDGKRKIRRWIKIMKGNETILPKTQISTTYDQNGNTITEVKEDYDTNKITISFPEYYLTGSTQMPTQKPQLPQGEYKIEIYQTYTATTPLIKQPINLIQMPFNLTFYHHDHLGTTRYITNENGEILHTTDTLAYGEELTSPYENDKDEVLNTITYTGHEKDYETDLTYMLARYYSQGYGRFLSPDPGYDYDQLDPMSWNLYAYVRGNPIKSLDPTGEMTFGETEYRAIYLSAPEGQGAKALERYGKMQRNVSVSTIKSARNAADFVSKASGIIGGISAPLSETPMGAAVTGAAIAVNGASSATVVAFDAILVSVGEEKGETLKKDFVSFSFNFVLNRIVSNGTNNNNFNNFVTANLNFVFSTTSIFQDTQSKNQSSNNGRNSANTQSISKDNTKIELPHFNLKENSNQNELFKPFKKLPCFLIDDCQQQDK